MQYLTRRDDQALPAIAVRSADRDVGTEWEQFMGREAIVNLLNLYPAALDSHGWQLFDQLFSEDVEADYPGPLHWWDLATFKRDFSAYHEALASHQHVMSNHQVVISGDTANSLTYGQYRLTEKAADEWGGVREGCCWYDDEFVRTPKGWRIRKRTARVFWSSGSAPGGTLHSSSNASANAGIASLLFAEAQAGRVAYFNALNQAIGATSDC